MRYFWLVTVTLCSLALFGCGYYSSLSQPHEIRLGKEQYDFLLEEQQEGDVKHSVSKLIDLFVKLDKKYPKSVFIITHTTENKRQIDEIKTELKWLGILPNRLYFNLNNEKPKHITIQVNYPIIVKQNCGTLSLQAHSDYQFGCSLNYNYQNSLAQPIKEKM